MLEDDEVVDVHGVSFFFFASIVKLYLISLPSTLPHHVSICFTLLNAYVSAALNGKQSL